MELLLKSHAETTDAAPDLVRRAQAGDAVAFEQLYRQHVGHVYAVCLRMRGNAERAETLTQDAFVQAWQRLNSFRGESTFSTWLHRLTVNVVLADLRAERRRWARIETADDLTVYDEAEPSPAPEMHLDLEAGIAALPPQARAVLVLHDIEGYAHEEIGGMMGIAEGTSKAHLHRARKLLQRMLKR